MTEVLMYDKNTFEGQMNDLGLEAQLIADLLALGTPIDADKNVLLPLAPEDICPDSPVIKIHRNGEEHVLNVDGVEFAVDGKVPPRNSFTPMRPEKKY